MPELVVSEPESRSWTVPSIVVPPPGPRSRALGDQQAELELPSFEARRETRQELSGEEHSVIVYERGLGSVVECVDGNRYVDMVAGFGALALGYGFEALTTALHRQMMRLPMALGDVFPSEVKVEALRKLVDVFGRPSFRVMVASSGSDAVGIALKSAELATGRPGVVAFHASYHGLAHGPLAVCGLSPKMRDPFTESISRHVRFAPYPRTESELDASLSAVQDALKTRAIGAVIVEPLLGRGGGFGPPSGFLGALRKLCTDYDTLLITDEILTGGGRTGQWLAAATVEPDLVCIGKAIGGGFPVSACLGTADVMAAWGRHGGSYIHTATHFASPLAAQAVLTTLSTIEERGLLHRVRELGRWWKQALSDAGIDAHVSGLHVGIPLRSASVALAVTRKMLSRGYIVLTGGLTGESLILTPAYTIEKAQLQGFTDALADTLKSIP